MFRVLLVLVPVVVLGAWAAYPTDPASRPPDLVWGVRGVRPGDLARPRAATFDGDGRLWIVDFTARIQAFDADGKYLGVTFTPPDFRNGRPSGLGTDKDGRLIVADSHYHCVRVYSATGIELLRLDGGRRKAEGGEEGSLRLPPSAFRLGYVSDCVQDADGFWYVSEFGDRDQITKLAADGTPVTSWGESGGGPGQLNRVRALALGPDGLLYAADACNHRIQAFDRDGRFVKAFGGPGAGPGEFSYPYDLAFGPGGELYVVERGNARVQKLTADGTPLGTWGRPGRGPGELSDPWAVAVDRDGRVHVIDTENHRVQRVRF